MCPFQCTALEYIGTPNLRPRDESRLPAVANVEPNRVLLSHHRHHHHHHHLTCSCFWQLRVRSRGLDVRAFPVSPPQKPDSCAPSFVRPHLDDAARCHGRVPWVILPCDLCCDQSGREPHRAHVGFLGQTRSTNPARVAQFLQTLKQHVQSSSDQVDPHWFWL